MCTNSYVKYGLIHTCTFHEHCSVHTREEISAMLMIFSFTRLPHDSHMNESWLTYQWVMVQVWISHGSRINKSWWHIIWMTHSYGNHDTSRVTWLMHMSHAYHVCDTWVTHHMHDSYAWVMSHIWMIHGTHMNESSTPCFLYVPWRIHVCAMSYSHICHDLYICEPWFGFSRVWVK